MKFLLMVFVFAISNLAHADLIKCDPKKAARNAAMDATVGVSGRCDPGKLVEDEKDQLVDGVEDRVDGVGDKKKEREKERKQKDRD